MEEARKGPSERASSWTVRIWGGGCASVFPGNAKWVPEHTAWLYHGPKPREGGDSTSHKADAQSCDSDASETTQKPIE